MTWSNAPLASRRMVPVGLMPASSPAPSTAFLFGKRDNSYKKVPKRGVNWKSDGTLAAQFVAVDPESSIFVVTGHTGTGKSTKSPLAILEAFPDMQARGVEDCRRLPR